MDFFGSSIIRKVFVKILLFGLILSGFVLIYYFNDIQNIPFFVFPVFLGAFFVFILLNYYVDIVRPLKIILEQMQALVTGKPFKKVFTARVDEIGILAYFYNKITEGLGKATFDIKDRNRMLEELTLASQLQNDILPSKTPSISGLQIVAKTKPATELGGDLFNFITIKDKTYAYIGDVTGHGAAAGVIMFMVNVLITVFSETCKSAYEILVNVNKHLKKYVKKSMYMTLVMISFDSTTKKFTYTGAGHEHILVYRAATGQCEAIVSGGIALGMLADNSKIIKEKEVELDNGDFIALYSDGITECRNDKGELFGLERLQASLSEHGQTYDALGVHFHVAKDVSEFMKNQTQLDDMTLIILKRDDNLVADNQESAKTIKW